VVSNLSLLASLSNLVRAKIPHQVSWIPNIDALQASIPPRLYDDGKRASSLSLFSDARLWDHVNAAPRKLAVATQHAPLRTLRKQNYERASEIDKQKNFNDSQSHVESAPSGES
jgi:hypothetical protein